MKEIVIISGKGGTGKTSVAAALACVSPQPIVVADCDVDASDMHLILKPDNQHSEDYYSGVKAMIDPALCTNCGVCAQICRFEAITVKNGSHLVNQLDCEGCGYCQLVCPVSAITTPTQKVGRVHKAITRIGVPLVHAKLDIGADNSGKLVAKVKRDARALAEQHQCHYILVDGSPGIGCPVISSLSGADLVILVTEPSRSGLEDMKRVWELARRFDLKAACVINKADLNPGLAAEIHTFLKSHRISLLAELPYHQDFTAAITQAVSLVEYDPPEWKHVFQSIWDRILKELK